MTATERERFALRVIEDEARRFQNALAARLPAGHVVAAPAAAFASSVEKLAQLRLAETAPDAPGVADVLRRARPAKPDATHPADMAGAIVALCTVLELGAAFYAAIWSRAGADLPPFAAKLADGVWAVLIVETAEQLAIVERARNRLMDATEVGHG